MFVIRPDSNEDFIRSNVGRFNGNLFVMIILGIRTCPPRTKQVKLNVHDLLRRAGSYDLPTLDQLFLMINIKGALSNKERAHVLW